MQHSFAQLVISILTYLAQKILLPANITFYQHYRNGYSGWRIPAVPALYFLKSLCLTWAKEFSYFSQSKGSLRRQINGVIYPPNHRLNVCKLLLEYNIERFILEHNGSSIRAAGDRSKKKKKKTYASKTVAHFIQDFHF